MTLQSPIVQQRDLNGIVHAERLRKEFLRTLEDSVAVLVGLDVDGFLPEPLGRNRGYGVESTVLRERRAAGQEYRRDGDARNGLRGEISNHFESPPCS